MYKILIIGSGGREHAILRAVAASQHVEKIYVIPGADAFSDLAESIQIDINDHDAILNFAKQNSIDLTIVGPEAPLVAGIASKFREAGLKILGPSSEASQLEASKVFTKDFLKKYHIPSAEYEVFANYEDAVLFLEKRKDKRWVIKADGLAAGKGVFIPENHDESILALKKIMLEKEFGASGNQVVIEEFLDGDEVSFIALCDGRIGKPLATSQDHKRLKDNDEGPNTGGMGAYSPAPIVGPELHMRIMEKVINPTLEGLLKENIPYQGVLYAGLMIVKGEPYVLEYNVRLGDPEAQVILPRLKSDFVELVMAAVDGNLENHRLEWLDDYAVTIVLAAPGYPEVPKKNIDIQGLDLKVDPDTFIYHAATKRSHLGYVSKGGRVLCVTALGRTLNIALKKAYEVVDKIEFEGKQFRKDIGKRGLIHK
jgi:phosphoribosylamine--glycine ligase